MASYLTMGCPHCSRNIVANSEGYQPFKDEVMLVGGFQQPTYAVEKTVLAKKEVEEAPAQLIKDEEVQQL